MGTIHHHAIVATTYDKPSAAALVNFARGIKCPAVMYTPEMVTNGYVTVCIGPDGSKEGWAESDRGNERRESIIAYLRRDATFDWIEVAYGECGAQLVRTNCKDVTWHDE